MLGTLRNSTTLTWTILVRSSIFVHIPKHLMTPYTLVHQIYDLMHCKLAKMYSSYSLNKFFCCCCCLFFSPRELQGHNLTQYGDANSWTKLHMLDANFKFFWAWTFCCQIWSNSSSIYHYWQAMQVAFLVFAIAWRSCQYSWGWEHFCLLSVYLVWCYYFKNANSYFKEHEAHHGFYHIHVDLSCNSIVSFSVWIPCQMLCVTGWFITKYSSRSKQQHDWKLWVRVEMLLKFPFGVTASQKLLSEPHSHDTFFWQDDE